MAFDIDLVEVRDELTGDVYEISANELRWTPVGAGPRRLALADAGELQQGHPQVEDAEAWAPAVEAGEPPHDPTRPPCQRGACDHRFKPVRVLGQRSSHARKPVRQPRDQPS